MQIGSPFFSIIIPTYNRAHLLSHAVSSVLNQTFQDFELIVIDDGGTDNTPQLLQQQFSDIRIRYYRQVNNGVTSARNLGATKAVGEFLLFLDSDDWLSKDYLTKSYESLYNNKFRLLLSSIRYFDNTGNIIKVTLPKRSGTYYSHPLTGSFVVSAALYRELGGYDELLTYSENSDFFLRLFSEEFLHLNEIVVEENINICIRFEENKIRNRRHAKKRYENTTYFLNKHVGHFNGSLNDFVNFKKIQALSALQQGRRDVSLNCLRELIQRKPFSYKSLMLYLFVLLLPATAKRYYS